MTQQLLDALHLRSRTRSYACLDQRVLVVLEPAQHEGIAVNVSEECGGIDEDPSPRQDHAKPTPRSRQAHAKAQANAQANAKAYDGSGALQPPPLVLGCVEALQC